MIIKKNKIVCVYQDLANFTDSINFSFRANVDFVAKECIIKQITYTSELKIASGESYDPFDDAKVDHSGEYKNFVVWSSLNNNYICSFTPFGNQVWQNTTTGEKFIYFRYDESPDTKINLYNNNQPIDNINFSVHEGPGKATSRPKGKLCLILEFRE